LFGTSLIFGRETRVAALGLGITAAYFIAVLASGYVAPGQLLQLFRMYLFGLTAVWLFLFCLWLIVILWQGRPKDGKVSSPLAVIRERIAERVSGEDIVTMLWPLLLFAALISSFNAFKQQILSTQPFAHDPWLVEADRWLFFGKDGWRFFHDWFGSPAATDFIDTFYHVWFLPMALGVVACAFLGTRYYQLRTQYLLTYIFVWIGLGSVMAFLMPSAGPCFYTDLVGPQESYAAMMETLRAHDTALGNGGGNLVALNNMHHLLNAYTSDTLAIGGGISAMPSVHNGLAILFALGAFRINRWLGYLLGAYALLIWVGSVYLGWHYGLDGVVAAIATIGFWKLAGRIAIAFDRPALEKRPLAPAV
jgi:membrane-associated phospholipid phosphatase